MQTTQLYVELIIIGLEGSIGIAFTFISLFGFEKFNKLISYLNTLPATIIAIGFLYILGLLLDRFADLVFQKLEDKFREQSGIQAKSVLVLLTKTEHIRFLESMRTRTRILRASTIITLFSTIMAVVCFVVRPINDSLNAIVFCGLLGLFLFIVSYYSYRKILKRFYEGARAVELENIH